MGKQMKKCYIYLLVMLFAIFSNLEGLNVIKAASASSLIKTWSIKKDGVPLTNLSIVYKDDTLDIRYDLVDLKPGENIKKGEMYEIALPSNVVIASNSNWQAKLGNDILCNCHYNPDTNFIEVIFNDGIFTDTYAAGITDAYIGFYANVDSTGKTAGDSCKLEGPDSSGTEFDIFYGGDKSNGTATVKKVCSEFDTATKTIEWTIAVTEGSTPLSNILVKDTISDSQAYIEDSFNVDGVSKIPTISDKTLIYNIGITDPFPNREHIINYKTTVFPSTKENGEYIVIDGSKSDITINAENKVSVYASEGTSELSSSKANVNCEYGRLKWIEKKYMNLEIDPSDSKARILTWQVKVHTNGYTYKNVVIKDKIIAGDVAESTLSYIPGSFIMTKDGTDTNIATVAGNPTFVNGVCDWQTETIPSLEGDYTITYKTKISNYTNYKYNNTTKITNTAYATFDEMSFGGVPGIGPGKLPEITVDAGDVATKEASLAKTVPEVNYSYDVLQVGAEVHGCPWTITVNEDQENLDSSFYLVETIGGYADDSNKMAQVIKGGSNAVKEDVIFDVMINDKPATDTEYNQISIDASNPDKVKIMLGNLLSSGKKVSFRFQTYLADSEREYYEGQHWTDTGITSRIAYNTVSLYDDNTEIIAKGALMYIYTNLFIKEFSEYDYSNNDAIWKFQINRDMMALNNVKVTDVLNGSVDKIELVKHNPNSHNEQTGIKMEISTTPNNDGIYYTFDKSTKKVVVNFGNIPVTQTYTMYIYEKIDPEDEILDEGIKKTLASYNGEINLSNTAVMSKDGSGDITATAKGKIDNKLFDKNAILKSKGKATYSIRMNQGHKIWPQDSEIVDIMSKGLMPDISSFELYVANVASNGSMTTSTLVPKSNYSIKVEILESDNSDGAPVGSVKTIIKLPNNANNNAYIINYDVYVSEDYSDKAEASFTNTVTVNGNPNAGILASKTLSLSQLMGYGSGTISYSKVKVVKKNETGELLPGVTFDLIYNNTVIKTSVTDNNGEIIFSDLTPGLSYTLREVKAPEGYEKSKDVTFSAPARGSSSLIDNPIIVVNKLIDDSDKKDTDDDDKNNNSSESTNESTEATSETNDLTTKEEIITTESNKSEITTEVNTDKTEDITEDTTEVITDNTTESTTESKSSTNTTATEDSSKSGGSRINNKDNNPKMGDDCNILLLLLMIEGSLLMIIGLTYAKERL